MKVKKFYFIIYILRNNQRAIRNNMDKQNAQEKICSVHSNSISISVILFKKILEVETFVKSTSYAFFLLEIIFAL